MKFTIGAKLLASSGVILLLVMVIGVYVLSSNQKALEQAVGQGSVFLVEDTIQRIDKGIFLKLEEMERFTSDPLLQQELKISNEAFEKLPDIDAYIKEQDEEWLRTAPDEITPFMESLIMNPLADRLEAVFIAYSERKYGYRTFGETIVTNKFGANIAITNKTEDYFQADETWWEGANEDVFSIGGFDYDESSAVWGIPLSVRIVSGDGEFLGVLKTLVPAGVIAREAEITNKKYDTTELLLLTDDNRVIYKTGAFRFLEDISTKDFFDKIHYGETGFFVEVEGGREKLFSYTHSEGFHNYAGLGWALIISHDTEEVFAPVRTLRDVLISIFSILLLVIVLLAYALSRSISRPVKQLTKTVQAVGAGNLSKRARVGSRDEVGILATTFNSMIEKLEVVDKAKSEFISLASHQLRTPLTSMRLFTEMLLEGQAGELTVSQTEYINNVHESIERMIDLVNDLLNVSRLEAKQLEVVPQPTQLKTFLWDIINEVKPLVDAKKARIEFQIPEVELPEVPVDTSLLRQIITNFLSNALQYIPEGGNIIVKLAETAGEYVMSVEDNGIGIPKEVQERIFEKFFRADNAIKKETDKSGLGLYVAKMIMDTTGGRIWFESKEGEGTTFYVTIPKEGMKGKEVDKIINDN